MADNSALDPDYIAKLVSSMQSGNAPSPYPNPPSNSTAPTSSPVSMPPTGTAASPALSYYRPSVSANNPLSAIISALTGGRISQSGAPVAATNVNPNSDMTKQLGLPDVAPIGKDNQGNPLFDYAEASKRNEDIASLRKMQALRGMTNPTFSSDEELSNASGKTIDIPTAHKMRMDYAATHGGADFPMSELKTAQTGIGITSRAQIGNRLADIKQQQVDTFRQRLAAMELGPQARQAGMQDAQSRMNNIERFYGIYDRIQGAGFQATKLERSLANTEVARVIAGSGGVLTDEGFNRVAQDSGMQAGGNFVSWITNTATPVQFKSFLDNAAGLMDNEYANNARIFRRGQQNNAQDLGFRVPPSSASPALNPTGGRPNFDVPSSNPQPKPVNTNGKVKVRRKSDGAVGYKSAQQFMQDAALGNNRQYEMVQ